MGGEQQERADIIPMPGQLNPRYRFASSSHLHVPEKQNKANFFPNKLF
jgi:hypothetical protein